MDKKTQKKMAKMVDAVQPHCDEEIIVAMTCSHAGSMSSVLVSKVMDAIDAISEGANTSDLPNPVFIAVGSKTIFAFDYKPRGFKFKIKKEVARWPRDAVRVEAERSRLMATFALITDSGESYPLEIPTMMGGKELVDEFLEVLGSPPD